LCYEAAENLSKFRGEIHLNTLPHLSDWTAEALSGGKADLYLEGITEINKSVAYSLSKHQGYLDLSGLKKLPPEIAAALITRWERHDYRLIGLDLNGLTELSDQTAEILSHYPGSSLSLNGLKTFSPSVARFLARSKCNLRLFGLKELCDGAAKAFAKYRRRIDRMAAKEFVARLRANDAA
ncbi:hypothetical protein N9073_06210, partial [Akkermansiaceae bacterium]|nr:hypothetical protein [Akkermansiaceae bacterium]